MQAEDVDWNALCLELERAADTARAAGMAAYMRGKFVFLGIATPQRRKICRPFFSRGEAKRNH